MFRISCVCQNYEWGKSGHAGIVGRMAAMQTASDSAAAVSESKPYAELWMGTHEKGPSKVFSTGQLLSGWLRLHRDAIGERMQNSVKETNGGLQLPFLFKVLAVNKALSIQAHPDKAEAARLHKRDAQNYPDPNHKPEMAVALSPFEMMCSFRPFKEILKNFEDVAELRSIVGEKCYAELQKVGSSNGADKQKMKSALQASFTTLMNYPDDKLQEALQSLLSRIHSQHPKTVGNVDAQLILRLCYWFPGDVGCFAPFFLNHFYLQPGEAVFLAPNEPHAYIFGDCIECMACSDNTVRAGLTPKYKDVETLCRILTYRCIEPQDLKLVGKPLTQDPFATVYTPPVSEFEVHKINVTEKGKFDMATLPVCSMFVTVAGEADAVTADGSTCHLSCGFVGFIPAQTSLHMSVKQSPLLLYRALYNYSHF